MDRFLADFAAIVPADTQAVMVLDGAGWHDERSVTVPPHVTLVPLPPYSPELNPVERVWLYLRERYLSHRLHPDYEAVVNACCRAWNALTAEPGRIPWIVALHSPVANKVSQHRVQGGDVAALLALIVQRQKQAEARLGPHHLVSGRTSYKGALARGQFESC